MKPNESPAGSAAQAAPQGAQQPASPFPPAFHWATSPQEAPTQVMRAFRRDTDLTEVTQVLPSSPHYQQRLSQGRDLFQPRDNPMSKPAATRLDDPFTKPSATSAPPWADAGEASGTAAKQSSFPQIIGIVVLAVVVLGLVGAAVGYFLTAGSPERTDSAASQPTKAARDLPAPPAALPEPVDTAHALIEPPGQTRGGGGPFDLPRLESDNLGLPRPILNTLQAGGMTDGVLKTTTTAGSTTIGMFAFTMPDQKAAVTVARTIAAVQYKGGLLTDNERSLQGVTVLGSAPGPPETVYRAVYVLYNRAIYFEVFGPNRDAVLATVGFLINQQVTYAPPTVSGG